MTSNTDSTSLPPASETLLLSVVERFETAWEEYIAGRVGKPDLGDFLPVDSGGRLEVLRLLTVIDLERRSRGGERIAAREYLDRYPELRSDTAESALIVKEYELALAVHPALDPRAFVQKYVDLGETALVEELEAFRLHLTTLGLQTVSEGRTARPSSSGKRMPVIPGYVILAELGRGGMGVVWKARQVKADRLVALKMIRHGEDAGDEDRARFRIEAEAAARLQHPNVVQIFEVGDHENQPYFSLEYCDGGTLATYLGGAPIAAREAAVLIRTLAVAIHHAHQQGVVHRDLKPANVLLQRAVGRLQIAEQGTDTSRPSTIPLQSAVPKIADFGLARKIDTTDDQTHTGRLLGTPSYMAPEQASGAVRDLGPAVDIYSLGVILYECLTGHPPFKAATLLGTLELVRQQEPLPPRSLQPGVPRDLETICLKCLRKDPSKRYATAQELTEDLQRFLDGEPIYARPAGSVERLAKWVKRRPAVASLLGVSVLTIVLVITGLVRERIQGDEYTRKLEEENAATEKQRREAVEQKGIADSKKAAAERAEKTAEEERRKALERATRLVVEKAQRAMVEGNLNLALLHSLEAVQLAGKEPDASIHELRVATLLRQCPRLVQVFSHEKAITHLEFSPDGRLLLSAGKDSTARLWDLATGRQAVPALRHAGPVNHAAFRPDGKQVLTGSEDRTACLWDVATGKPVFEALKGPYPVTHVAFQPRDGRFALVGSGVKYARAFTETRPGIGGGAPMQIREEPEGLARLWDTQTGKPLENVLAVDGWLNHASFSRDGHRVALAAGYEAPPCEVKIWELDLDPVLPAWKLAPLLHLGSTPPLPPFSTIPGLLWPRAPVRNSFKPFHLPAHVNHVSFSPRGDAMIAACGQVDSGERTAEIWDLRTGHPTRRVLTHLAPVTHAWFNGDGRTVLTASLDGAARLWNVETGQPMGAPMAHKQGLAGAWFSPDGSRILTASFDGTARVWSANGSGQPLSPLLTHGDRIEIATFSPDGRHVATGGQDGSIRLWDLAVVADEQPSYAHQSHLQLPLPLSETVTLDAPDNRANKTRQFLDDLAMVSAHFSPDDQHIVTVAGRSYRDTIAGGGRTHTSTGYQATHFCIWNSKSMTPLLIPVARQSATSADSLDPHGKKIVGFGPKKTLQIVEVLTGKGLLDATEKLQMPQDAAFDATGRCLVVDLTAKRGTARVLDLETGRDILPAVQTTGPIEEVRLQNRARHLVVTSLASAKNEQGQKQFRWVTRVHDIEKREPIGPPLDHANMVTRVIVSPNGEYAVTFAPTASTVAVEFELAAQEKRYQAHLWHLGDGKFIGVLAHTGTVTNAAFSADSGLVVTTGEDHFAHVWTTGDGQRATPPLEHSDLVHHADFSPDGKMLVTSCEDGAARLWDRRTGELVAPPFRHQRGVLHASFRADGKALVTAGADAIVRVWDLGPDTRSRADQIAVSEFLTGQRFNAVRGLSRLPSELLRQRWSVLHERDPLFCPSLPAAEAWHRERLAEAETADEREAVLLHTKALLALDDKQNGIRLIRAAALTRLGRWDEAEAECSLAARMLPGNLHALHALAVVQRKRGDVKNYQQTCLRLLAQLDRKMDALTVAQIVRICILAEGLIPKEEFVVQMADALRTLEASDPRRRIYQRVLGAIHYRQGRLAEALPLLKDASAGSSSPFEHCFLAMVQRHQRNPAATRSLQQARNSISLKRLSPFAAGIVEPRQVDPFEPLDFVRRLEGELLLGEADALWKQVVDR